MDTTPFIIAYNFGNTMHSLEIKPCCNEDNVVDYAVWDNGQLLFTMARNTLMNKWIIALKNADDSFDEEVLQLIGEQIEKNISSKNHDHAGS